MTREGCKDDFILIAIALDDNGYESSGTLMVMSLDTEKSWVMDHICSSHMFLKKEYFETLELRKGRVVQLGNNKVFKVYDIGTVQNQDVLKM